MSARLLVLSNILRKTNKSGKFVFGTLPFLFLSRQWLADLPARLLTAIDGLRLLPGTLALTFLRDYTKSKRNRDLKFDILPLAGGDSGKIQLRARVVENLKSAMSFQSIWTKITKIMKE